MKEFTDDNVRALLNREKARLGYTTYALAKAAELNRTSLGYYLQGRTRSLRSDKLWPVLNTLGIRLPVSIKEINI